MSFLIPYKMCTDEAGMCTSFFQRVLSKLKR